MTKVKLTTPLGGHNAGDTIEVTQGSAHKLISENYAEAADETKPRTKAKGKSAPATTEHEADGGGASPTESGTTVG